MYNKLLVGGCRSVTTYVRKDGARFLNLLGVPILPNFLIFCKKISDQGRNENAGVFTRKKIYFVRKE
jgi:hypothetical protein